MLYPAHSYSWAAGSPGISLYDTFEWFIANFTTANLCDALQVWTSCKTRGQPLIPHPKLNLAYLTALQNIFNLSQIKFLVCRYGIESIAKHCYSYYVWVRCYYVPDHKHPLLYKTSLYHYFPWFIKSLVYYVSKYMIDFRSWRPHILCPCLERPWAVYDFCTLCPCITTSLWTSYPCSVWPFVHLIFNFGFELHQPMDWLGV